MLRTPFAGLLAAGAFLVAHSAIAGTIPTTASRPRPWTATTPTMSTCLTAMRPRG